MLNSRKQWLVGGFTAWAMFAGLGLAYLPAQESAKKESTTKEAAADDASDDAKAKGRLPAYFKEVVDSQQRDKIYDLQSDYAAKIAPLQEQIKKLVAERDSAVEKVLTAEQQSKLKKIRDEATAKRKTAGLGPAKKEATTKDMPAK